MVSLEEKKNIMSALRCFASIALLTLVSYGAQAACEADPAHYKKEFLSERGRSLRDGFYVVQCIRGGGSDLVDENDPTLGKRLERQKSPEFPVPNTAVYSALGKKLGVKADTVVAMIIEADGSVSDTAVLESSGVEQFDAIHHEQL